ncbi:MAG: deoxynucleoside kinase [Desulfobulbus sp.]|nr:deoxynucleoside kinase [Desulfobulbus sp.]
MNRIEICGNIASGKTTLCQCFHHKNFPVTFEDFKTNPFYEAFYQNPQAYSFETELTFLLQHYHAIKIRSQVERLVCDYSMLQDMAYADVNLTGNRHHIFFEVVHEIQKEIGHPQAIIYLTCPEDLLLERIRARSREAETSITIDYLKALAGALSARVKSVSSQTNVISIKSDLVDFRSGIGNIPELARL